MRPRTMTDQEIVRLLRESEAGRSVRSVCKEEGIALSTFYRWRAEQNEQNRAVRNPIIVANGSTNQNLLRRLRRQIRAAEPRFNKTKLLLHISASASELQANEDYRAGVAGINRSEVV